MIKISKILGCIFALVCVLVIIITSCEKDYEYEFMQPQDNIISIEFVYADPFSLSVDYIGLEANSAIDKNLWIEFIEDLKEVPCKRYRFDPANSVRYNVIRIAYKDGSFELFSNKSTLRIDANGNMNYTMYYFDKNAFDQFVEKYST